MTARGPQELADQSGVPASYIERLVELEIVIPTEDGTFSDGDVNRVRFVHASDRGGLSLEAIARSIREGRFSLAFLDSPQFRWASLSPGPTRRSPTRSASAWHPSLPATGTDRAGSRGRST
jgi:hypothetical protein